MVDNKEPKVSFFREEVDGVKRVIKKEGKIETVLKNGVYEDLEVKIHPKFKRCPFKLTVETDKNGEQIISIGDLKFSDSQLESFTFYKKPKK